MRAMKGGAAAQNASARSPVSMRVDEGQGRRLVGLVGIGPGRVDLGLAHRLGHGALEPLSIDRDGIGVATVRPRRSSGQVPTRAASSAYSSLRSGRRSGSASAGAGRRIRDQSGHRLGPGIGKLGQGGEPRPRVLAALGVVGRGRQHRMRPMLGAFGVGVVERLQRSTESRRVAADLVQRDEAVEPVERRVLETLGRDGAGILLEPHGGMQHGVAAEAALRPRDEIAGQQVVEESEDAAVDGRSRCAAPPRWRYRANAGRPRSARRAKSM